MRLFDAHNHLHDERFAGRQSELIRTCRELGVVRMVVNGSCEADWAAVAGLAHAYPDLVRPAFGLHPWYLRDRTTTWKETLLRLLDTVPHATVGEIGLDRWILECPAAARAAVSPELALLDAPSLPEQLDLFHQQLAIAAERNLPASLHCLQAWGALETALRGAARPARGVLLHSYGGPAEMLPVFAGLGAYFGFPGYFLHPRKARQREAFRAVPEDRLLIETDAPDQRLPEPWPGLANRTEQDDGSPLSLAGLDGRPLNHPANLRWILRGLAEAVQRPCGPLGETLERNFRRLFGA